MEAFIWEHHKHWTDRELICKILDNQFLIFQKLEQIMSQTTDLIAKLGEDIAGIATDVAGIGQEITDLKAQVAAGQDNPATIAALTDLEAKAAAAKTALDALVPAPPAATAAAEPAPAQ